MIHGISERDLVSTVSHEFWPLARRKMNSNSPDTASVDSIIQTDFRRHKSMISASSSVTEECVPILYVRKEGSSLKSDNSANSGRSLLGDQHYAEARRQLNGLKTALDDDGDPIIEDGAIDTAITLLEGFRSAAYSPPLVSWHGGDAVVMMWTVGNDTLAITVTDGEWGYVIRRNFRLVTQRDSMKPVTFWIKDSR